MGERPWRTIDWRGVDRIERRFVPEQSDGEGTSAAYELILFESGGLTIIILSSIIGYEARLDDL
jgi:hypothetical protein